MHLECLKEINWSGPRAPITTLPIVFETPIREIIKAVDPGSIPFSKVIPGR